MNKYSPIISEFGSAEEEASYLQWLTAKVEAARSDTRPRVAHDEAMARIRQKLARMSGKEC